jgi:hypothetical protein
MAEKHTTAMRPLRPAEIGCWVGPTLDHYVTDPLDD